MNLRVLSAAAFLLAVTSSTGCALASEPAPTAPNPADLTAPPGVSGPEAEPARHGRAHDRNHGRRGGSPVGRLVRAAASDASLDAGQRAALAALEEQLAATRAGTREATNAFRGALAKGVGDGALDDAEIAAAKARVVEARRAAVESEAEVLNRLHATLRPDQRKALVARLEERAPRGDAGAHRARRHHEADDGDARRGGAEGPRRRHDVETRLAARLELDDAQRARLAEAMKSLGDASRKSPEEKARRRAARKAAAESFASDRFDAHASPLVAMQKGAAADKADKRVARLRAVLSVLRPAQVERLAALLSTAKPGGRAGQGASMN